MTRASGQGLTAICSSTGLQASREGQREEERASGQRDTYEERCSERERLRELEK